MNDRAAVLQVAEFVFGEFCLLEDGTEGSGGNIPGVHRQVGLPSVFVTQYEMGSALPTFLETGALELAQLFFRLVRRVRRLPPLRGSPRIG